MAFLSTELLGDAVADVLELRASSATEEANGTDANNGDESDQECVLDEACATLALDVCPDEGGGETVDESYEIHGVVPP